jgi:hypothetical protein
MALRFTHNVFEAGRGELHMKTSDALVSFENDKVKGMAYWPMGGSSVVVSIARPDGHNDMYEVSVEQIVEAALRWRARRSAAASPSTSQQSEPLLPEEVDPTDGNLGGMHGSLTPPELPE